MLNDFQTTVGGRVKPKRYRLRAPSGSIRRTAASTRRRCICRWVKAYDPDALKTAMRINLEPGTSVDSVVGKLERLAGSGTDEAIVDAFAMFPSLDQMLGFAGQVIAEWRDRGRV
jgi:hypothetical protein